MFLNLTLKWSLINRYGNKKKRRYCAINNSYIPETEKNYLAKMFVLFYVSHCCQIYEELLDLCN